MAIQRIIVDLIPGAKDAPVINASQYDTGRQFEIELQNGGEAYSPSVDMSIELHVKKRDDTIIINSPINRTNNIITFSTTEQMTACHGKNLCEVALLDDGIVIGTANFILDVEKDPIEGGLTSESEIDNLTQQIADIVPQVIGNDYYNKTQTDALLADKADISDLATLASKAEVTQAISDEDTAVKNWVSSHFATPGYVATHYYTKLQVDDIINNMLPVGSASGNPCTFDTEIAAELQALTDEIVASGGGGTPSTPIPLVGHTELNLTRCGVNFLPSTYKTTTSNNIRYYWNATGGGLLLKANVTYCISVTQGSTHPAAIYVQDYNSGTELTHVYSRRSVTYTPTTDVRVRFDIYYANSDLPTEPLSDINCQVELGSTATAYEPYNGQTFTVAFGQTVYGGMYDKSGRLTITHATADEDTFTNYDGQTSPGGLHWVSATVDNVKNGHAVASMLEVKNTDVGWVSTIPCLTMENGRLIIYTDKTSLADFKTYYAGLEIAYELATPIVIDVQAISPSAEHGTNTITSDCIGDVNASYKDTIQHYIDSRI